MKKPPLCRVIGAIVIIIGLYLVVWGKRKDYKSPSIEEQGIQVNQIVDGYSGATAAVDEEVIDDQR